MPSPSRGFTSVLCLIACCTGLTTKAFEPPVADGTPLKEEGRVAFTEGPAWHPDGSVYFSDIANNRIMRRDADGMISVWRMPSGRTNGMVFDLQGRLICGEGGGAESNRRVTRTESDGSITVLADSFGGKPLNSPNDCTIDRHGRIYFSDPRYGDRSTIEQFDDARQAIEGVYRIDGPGMVSRVLAHEVDRPNGLAISPDGNWLYVADNVNGLPAGTPQNRRLWRFKLNSDGSTVANSRRLMFDWGTDRGPDGMAIDVSGRLYVAAGFNHPNDAETAHQYKAGIYVISPEGQLEQVIPVPIDMVTNCAFGDSDLQTLYVTAGHKLWSIRTRMRGHVLFKNQ